MLKLNKSEKVQISIYDIKGRKVNTLTENVLSAGNHRFNWNTENKEGKKVASGIYFIRVLTQNKAVCRKIMVIK